MAPAARKKQSRNWFRNEGSGSSMPVQRSATSMMPSVSYFNPLSNFFMDMDRMFDNAFRGFGLPSLGLSNMPNLWGVPSMFRPNVDIASNDNTYTINIEVPGMDEKDIRLNVSEDGVLTVSGEKRLENMENRKDVVCAECSYGAFQRVLSLPEDADADNISAQFRNGVLTITCPRRDTQEAQTRQIPIGRKGQGSREGQESSRTQAGGERGSSSVQQNPKKAA